ncbi:hypothetical protein [Comamonas sp.]|uniref:hypothetical protein n=1 Tax=Comamonas sp. TaxID=34028 RepID=UPI0025868412|nr:hypothetical protein [Comamonas sp.]
MAQKFIGLVAGKFKQIAAIVTSAGAADAGKIIAAGTDGKLHTSLLPTGIGANSVSATASEAIAAGKLVNLWVDAGAMKLRLADNSNGREAWGYLKEGVSADAAATAYRLNTVMPNQTGLTVGGDYWLGTAGGVISAAPDATDDANSGKLNQYIGKATSATEIATVEVAPVEL